MKLYYHSGACSLAPHIICHELGVPVELIDVDRKNHRTPSGDDYLKIHALGYVPALQLDDGTVITEGPAITQYLADQHPDAGLAPRPGTPERTRLHTWLNFITSELHKPIAMLMAPEFQPVREPLVAKVGKRLDWVVAQLAGPYTMGDHFTVADPYLFTCLNWTAIAHVELARWPALVAFQQRVAARPSVQAALDAETLRNVPGTVFYAPEAMLRARRLS